MSVKISELSAMSALAGTEVFVGVQTTTKKATATQISTYANGVLLAASAGTPAAGDNLLVERGGSARRLDLDTVAAYVVGSAWTEAGTVGDAASGDLMLIGRAGTVHAIDVDDVVTYARDGIQATVLNVSGLNTATLADSDQYLVTQGTTAKKTTWASMAARAHSQFSTAVAALDAVVTPGDTDKTYCLQGATAKYVANSVLAAYFETKATAGILTAVLATDAVTPVVGTDIFVLKRSDTRKTATGVALGAYTTSLLTGADPVSPVAAADKFLLARGGVAKTADIDVLAAYIGDKATTEAATETTFATGDLVVFNRSGATKTITIANVVSHVLDGVQATVLNVSALDTATLADALLLPICDVTVGKKATLGNVAAHVHAGMRAYTTALGDGAPLVDDDVLYVARASSAKKMAASDVATYAIAKAWDQSAAVDVLDADQVLTHRGGTGYQLTTVEQIADHVADAVEAEVLSLFDEHWKLISTDNYTATPDSTSKILMSDTGEMQVGYPVRYTYGGVAYYGVVASMIADTEITVRGAPLNTGVDLTDLRVGPPSHVVVQRLLVPGAYLVPWHYPNEEGTKDLLAEIARRSVAWRHGPAKLVGMAVVQRTVDGTAQPKFNAKIGGDAVLTSDGGAGVQVSGTEETWVWASAVAIDTNEYSIAGGDAIEILCTASGSDGDACDLSVDLVFVLE